MLATERGIIVKNNSTKELKISNLNNPLLWTSQHLYILSDDEITNVDYWLDIDSNKIYQDISLYALANNAPSCKRVIATTDTSLFIEVVNQCDGCKSKIPLDGYIHRNERGVGMACSKDKYKDYLPQLSKDFIEKYITEYNKGNIIKDVLVQYENNLYEHFGSGKYWEDEPVIMKKFLDKDDQYLRVNNRDNTITIKTPKESWDKEEVKQKMRDSISYCLLNQNDSLEQINNWIEENL